MSLIKNCILLLWMSLPALTSGSSGEELKYDFFQSDSSYSFRGSFVIDAEPHCLKNVIFDFEHVKMYASGAKNIKMVKKEAIEFLHEFREYTERECVTGGK